MTFSIVARCAKTQMFGVAIASSSPAVAARCAHARARTGAVASQNITDPSLGPRVLDGLAQGRPAAAALREVLNSTKFAAFRQVLAIGVQGAAVIHSGAHTLGLAGSATGEHCAAAGNLLAREDVPAAMVRAFEADAGAFGVRLLQALHAGAARGGEEGPIRSAGLLIVREVSWPIVDLRIDWADAPIAALGALWEIYAPQIDDYVRRAIDPARATSFGVPGNL